MGDPLVHRRIDDEGQDLVLDAHLFVRVVTQCFNLDDQRVSFVSLAGNNRIFQIQEKVQVLAEVAAEFVLDLGLGGVVSGALEVLGWNGCGLGCGAVALHLGNHLQALVLL